MTQATTESKADSEDAMIRPDLPSICHLMLRAAEKAHKTGARVGIDDVFPFQPDEVEGIHTHKVDEGPGLWFRLKDGRVFTKFGLPAPYDPALYGAGKYGSDS